MSVSVSANMNVPEAMPGDEDIEPQATVSISDRARPGPRSYAARIQEYVDQEAASRLFSSINYRQLAAYLNAPYLVDSAAASQRAVVNQPRACVHVSSLNKDGKTSMTSYNDISRYGEFDQALPDLTATSVHVWWLQGLPSAKWISTLGAQYRIDPEHFRKHLRFLQPQDSADQFALPSSSPNSVTLRLMTVYTRSVALGRQALEEARHDAESAPWIHQRSSVAHQRHGTSIVRKYHVLESSMFAIEQELSIYVKRRRNGWIAVACVDIGNEIEAGSPLPPWLKDEAGSTPVPWPIFSQRPKNALQSYMKDRQRPTTHSTSKYPPQAGQQLPFHVHSVGLNNPLNQDIRDSLSEIFEFSAAAENQFLNVMNTLIDRELKQQTSGAEAAEWTLNNLRYFQELIDSHVTYLDQIITFLKISDPASEWTPYSGASSEANHRENISSSPQSPVASPATPQSPSRSIQNAHPPLTPGKANSHIQLMQSDHAHLRAQALKLSTHCHRASQTLLNMALLEESKTAIQQAKGIIRLTSLAFVFIPISLTTSFFGMNFQEFGTGILRIWVCFVTGILVLVPSLIVGFWDANAFQKLRKGIIGWRQERRKFSSLRSIKTAAAEA